MVLSGLVEEDIYLADEPSDEDLKIPARNAAGRQHMVLDEGKSGIGWKFANQGIFLFLLHLYDRRRLAYTI